MTNRVKSAAARCRYRGQPSPSHVSLVVNPFGSAAAGLAQEARCSVSCQTRTNYTTGAFIRLINHGAAAGLSSMNDPHLYTGNARGRGGRVPFGFEVADARFHTHVIGKTGSGKPSTSTPAGPG